MQILALNGEITLEDCLKIKNLLKEYIMAGRVRVALDLSKVTHIHLAGLPALVERAQRLREYDGGLKLVGLSTYLRHIFQLAGALDQFDVCANVDEAQKHFEENR